MWLWALVAGVCQHGQRPAGSRAHSTSRMPLRCVPHLCPVAQGWPRQGTFRLEVGWGSWRTRKPTGGLWSSWGVEVTFAPRAGGGAWLSPASLQIQDIVRRRQLLTIFRDGKDGQQDVDVAILQALLKGE